MKDEGTIAMVRWKVCFVDVMVGLSESHKAIRKAQDEVVYDSTKKGYMDDYHFGDGQLITWVHNTKKGNDDDLMASKSIGATKFEPYNLDDKFLSSNEEEEDGDTKMEKAGHPTVGYREGEGVYAFTTSTEAEIY